MMTLEINRSAAIKLIHDRTNWYKLEHMTDKELADFLTKIGYGVDTNIPYYDCDFKIKENEKR